MKKIILIIWVFVIPGITPALSQQIDEAREKIESARIALITERLELTPSQAEKFWPVYREYQERLNSLRMEFRQAQGGVRKDNLSEEESRKMVELGLQLKEQQLSLEKTYSDRLSKIITNRQLLALRKAEDDFRRMLLERLERRRDFQRRRDNRRSQPDQ